MKVCSLSFMSCLLDAEIRESSGSCTRVQAHIDIARPCRTVHQRHQLLFPHGILDTNSRTRNKGETPIECIEEQEPAGMTSLVECQWEVDIRWGWHGERGDVGCKIGNVLNP